MTRAPAAEEAEALARSAQLVQKLAHDMHAELVETHISWVLLGPQEAWKFKKPLRTAFLDYRTLAERARLCAEEVRLNARLAPGLYLGVLPITGSPQAPRAGGDGPAIEYAVRMRRFDAQALFSERLAAGRLAPAEVDAMADLLARFHRQAPRAPADADCGHPARRREAFLKVLPAKPGNGQPARCRKADLRVLPSDAGYGHPARRRAAALGVLAGVRAAATPQDGQALQFWLQAQAQRLQQVWAQRLAGGMVRECHGDLHLANLLWLPEGPAAFDAIEFDPALRWIDVIDDIAFPVMDLAAWGRRDLAFRLLVRWLDGTGDHAGLAALRFSAVYRALVRAAVAVLRGPPAQAAAQRYLAAARFWRQSADPRLTLMHGLPGSGKTRLSQQLLEQGGAIRLRSDVERKRLFGLAMDADSRAAGLDLYTREAGERTYAELFARARALLAQGWPVILDAAFLRREERAQALALARSLGVPAAIVACEAPLSVLRERVAARRGDASEADLAVLETLAAAQQPFTPEESAYIRRCATA